MNDESTALPEASLLSVLLEKVDVLTHHHLATLLFVLVTLIIPAEAEAQIFSPGHQMSGEVPGVYLDCQTRRHCDTDHFRTEIQFVNWVWDQANADVHIVFTATSGSAGGWRYTMDFIGRGDLVGMDDQLTYTSHGTDVDDDVVQGLEQTIRLGLMRYAVELGQASQFDIQHVAEAAVPDDAETVSDPWNMWTFRAGLSGNVDIRETRSRTRVNPRLDADRVTEDWKVSLTLWAMRTRERIELGSGREIRNDTDLWRASGLIVRSLSDRMSIGVTAGGSNSVQNNQRVSARLRPAVEWNYFPYAQASRRQFLVHYSAGGEYMDYYEATIFEKDRELVPMHHLGVAYRARETWGNAGASLSANQYLHDPGLYAFGIDGELDVRIARGLELSISAGATRVQDQLYIPAGDISDEDILLGRQALPSGFRYQASIGFNYRWGSPFANVVNPRFPGSVR